MCNFESCNVKLLLKEQRNSSIKSGTYLNSALSSLKLEQLTAKILKENSNGHKGVSELWPKAYTISVTKHRKKFVLYHGANPNTRNGARSPSLVMAPVGDKYPYIFSLQLEAIVLRTSAHLYPGSEAWV